MNFHLDKVLLSGIFCIASRLASESGSLTLLILKANASLPLIILGLTLGLKNLVFITILSLAGVPPLYASNYIGKMRYHTLYRRIFNLFMSILLKSFLNLLFRLIFFYLSQDLILGMQLKAFF